MPATYKDIRRVTGLSLSTISKYFNGGSVRPETRRAIEKAVDKLDFRVNDFARGLKSRKSRAVGVLVPEITSTFHTTIMGQVGELLRRQGYSMLLCDCNRDEAREREGVAFLLDKMVDGILTIPLGKTGVHLQPARDRGVPVVLVDRVTTAFKTDAVTVDNRAAGASAADELLRSGHTRVGMVSGPDGIFTMRRRRRGFTGALRAAGCYHPAWDVRAEFTIEGGYAAARRLLALPDRPSALFCANYELTLGTIIAINEAGCRIPGDISLIGFDNLTLSRVLKPPLTLVMQPMEAIAQHATALLLARIEQPGGGETRRIELPTQLIRGGSVLAL